MKNLHILLLRLSLLISMIGLCPDFRNVFAQTKSESYSMQYGFFPESSRLIPEIIKSKKNAIFAVVIPDYETVEIQDYQSMILRQQGNSEGIMDIQSCQSAGLTRCLFRNQMMGRGTGFLLENGSTLWTCAHVIAGWFRYFKQKLIIQSGGKMSRQQFESELRKQEIPMGLLESNQQFSAASIGNKAVLESFVLSNESDINNIELSWANDAVGIHFEKPLSSEFFIFGNDLDQDRDAEIFVGGYPEKTSTRGPIGKLDSNGINFFWAVGKNLWNKDLITAQMAERLNASADSYQFLKSYGLFLTADTAPSSSGSPVLDSYGRVVGMVNLRIISNQLAPGEDGLPVLTRAIDLDGLKFVNHF